MPAASVLSAPPLGHGIAFPSLHRAYRAHDGVEQTVNALKLVSFAVHKPQTEVRNILDVLNPDRKAAPQSAQDK